MHMCKQWQLHCTISWGGRPHWMGICTMWLLHSKWLSKYSIRSASNFALSLNIPLQKLFEWFRRPHLWATGDWQLHHDSMSTHASCLVQSFLSKHQITQVIQSPNIPDLAPCDFWLFSKLKSPWKGKRFQTINETRENTTGQLMAIERTAWGPTVPTLKGTEASLSYTQRFLYLVSSINVSTFHTTWLDTFWTDCVCKCIQRML